MSCPDPIQTANRLLSRALVFEREGERMPELADLDEQIRATVIANLPTALRRAAAMLILTGKAT